MRDPNLHKTVSLSTKKRVAALGKYVAVKVLIFWRHSTHDEHLKRKCQVCDMDSRSVRVTSTECVLSVSDCKRRIDSKAKTTRLVSTWLS